MRQLTSNVFVETGIRGCNPGFVITSEGVVLIDTPLDASTAREWPTKLARSEPLLYVINTESHLDHVLNNALFPGAVVAHEATRAAIVATDLAVARERLKLVYKEPLPIPEGHQLKAPGITFADRLTLFVGSHTFKLLHLPGHTAGQTAVYVPEERVVFTGDNVFSRVQTFLQQALPDEWLESLRALEQLDVQFIVPGHGEVTDKSYLKEQASIIRGWVEAARRSKASGLSVDEALAQRVFRDPYPLDIGLNEAGLDLPRLNLTRLYEVVRVEEVYH